MTQNIDASHFPEQDYDERIHHAVTHLLYRETGGDGGCVFVKHMAKFSRLFDFATNWETSGGDIAAGRWQRDCLKLLAEEGAVLQHR